LARVRWPPLIKIIMPAEESIHQDEKLLSFFPTTYSPISNLLNNAKLDERHISKSYSRKEVQSFFFPSLATFIAALIFLLK